MNAWGDNRPEPAAKQAGSRGGVWSLSEVLAELLPRYAPPATLRDEVVPVAYLSVGWRPVEAELASCL